MKKIAFIFVFAFIMLFHKYTSAQTEKQTIDWIKQTFSELNIQTKDGLMRYTADVFVDVVPNSKTENEKVLNIDVLLANKGDTSILSVFLPLKRIAVYESNTDKFIVMNIVPKAGIIHGVYFTKINGEENAGSPEFTKKNVYNLKFVDNEFNRIRITKLIKAIRHLIKLSGGTVVDENLF